MKGRRVVVLFLGAIVVLVCLMVAAMLHFASSPNPSPDLRNLGVDAYPGATPEPGSGLRFTTSDPPLQVIEFYHLRYPDAEVQTQAAPMWLRQSEAGDTLTIAAAIAAEAQPQRTEIRITDQK